MKRIFEFSAALYFLLPLQSNALIISSNTVNTTITNNLTADLQGLEWLSFDDSEFATFGLSRADIEESNSLWQMNGWRYATILEAQSLFDSLGVVNGFDSNNQDGVNFILDNWGKYTKPSEVVNVEYYLNGENEPKVPGTVSTEERNYVSGIFGEYIPFPPESFIASFSDSYIKTFDFGSDGYWQNTKEANVFTYGLNYMQNQTQRSFLVRESNAVSEPSIFALMGLGLLGLGWGLSRKKMILFSKSLSL